MGCVGAGKEGEWAAVYHQSVLWKYSVQSQSGYGELTAYGFVTGRFTLTPVHWVKG